MCIILLRNYKIIKVWPVLGLSNESFQLCMLTRSRLQLKAPADYIFAECIMYMCKCYTYSIGITVYCTLLISK